MSAICTNQSPPWFTGHWRDWHRGHGCDRDDGRPRSAEAAAEIATHGRSTGFHVSVDWSGSMPSLRIRCALCGTSVIPAVVSLEDKLIEHSATCAINRQEASSNPVEKI